MSFEGLCKVIITLVFFVYTNVKRHTSVVLLTWFPRSAVNIFILSFSRFKCSYLSTASLASMRNPSHSFKGQIHRKLFRLSLKKFKP